MKSFSLHESLIDFRSESDVVECYSIVVAQDSLVLTCPPRVLALQHVVELIVLLELLEILEVLYLCCIVTKHFVEEEVAVLESSHVYGNERDAFLKKVVIGE